MRKIGAALGLALFCGSCTKDLIIEPAGSGTAVQLEFYEPGFVWRGSLGDNNFPAEPCISALSVAEEPSRSRGRVIWLIAARSGCVRLGKVEIGTVPGGFDEVVSRLPVRIGRMYQAAVRSRGASQSSRPWLVCPGEPMVVRPDEDYWFFDPPNRCDR